MEDYPFISLCMPIFERNNFIPLIINNLNVILNLLDI